MNSAGEPHCWLCLTRFATAAIGHAVLLSRVLRCDLVSSAEVQALLGVATWIALELNTRRSWPQLSPETLGPTYSLRAAYRRRETA